MSRARVVAFGDHAVEVTPTVPLREVDGLAWARRVARRIERAAAEARARGVEGLAEIVDVVAAYGVVVAHRDPRASNSAMRSADVRALVAPIASLVECDSDDSAQDLLRAVGAYAGVEHTVKVVYDGADLHTVAAEIGLSPTDVATLHAGRTYGVELVGFLPGFAYLGPVDPRLAVARLASPRRRVEAGSVAIAAGRTAVYPSASPGGWRLLGRALDVVAFDPRRAAPVLFRPGDRVRFEIVQIGEAKDVG